MPINIRVSEIKDLLSKGVTRTTEDKHYNPSIGSFEEKFGVSAADVNNLFKRNPVLKGLRVTPYVEPVFNLVDDTTAEEVLNEEEQVQAQIHPIDTFNSQEDNEVSNEESIPEPASEINLSDENVTAIN
jgi:hypothetical protein